MLGVSPFTIRRYIKLGELRAVKLLGGFRIHRDELQRFLKAHEVNPAEEELLPEETPGSQPEAAQPAGEPETHSRPEASAPPSAPPPAPHAAPARRSRRRTPRKKTRK